MGIKINIKLRIYIFIKVNRILGSFLILKIIYLFTFSF